MSAFSAVDIFDISAPTASRTSSTPEFLHCCHLFEADDSQSKEHLMVLPATLFGKASGNRSGAEPRLSRACLCAVECLNSSVQSAALCWIIGRAVHIFVIRQSQRSLSTREGVVRISFSELSCRPENASVWKFGKIRSHRQ